MKANKLSLLNTSAENVRHYALFIINNMPVESADNSGTIMLIEASIYRCSTSIVDALQ